jgi:O-antigen/teichoic acid export membrane protein
MVVPRRPDEVTPPGRPSIVASTAATYGTNVAVAVLSLVNVLIVSRALGPTGRGDVAFLTTVAFLTSNVAMLGVQEANANIGGREPRLRRALATNSLLLAGLLGLACAALVAGLVAVFPSVGGDVGSGVRWLALGSIPVLVLQTYLELLAQSDYKFALTNASWLLPPLANVAVNGALAGLGVLSVGTAVAAWIGGQALATALLAWYVGRRSAGFGRPDLRLARRALGFGVKTHAGRVMTLGNYRFDQWLLGGIAGSRELGLYSVAVAWAEALFFLPTVLVRVQRPDLVRASPREAARQAALAFRVAVLLTVVLAVGLIVLAPVLCVTIFGSDFRGSIDDLRILVPGAFGMVALKLFANALTAQGKPLHGTCAIAVAFVATVGLDLALIPGHGGAGAALASTVGYGAGGAAIAVIFARTLGARLGDLLPRGSEVPWFWRKLRSALS